MKKCLILILLALVCRMALASNPTWPAFDTNLNTLNPYSPLPSGYIAPNTNVIATRTWVTNNVHGDTNIVENPYTTNSTANANAYSTNNVADYKGAAHDATNGLGSAAFKNISFFDLAGSATAVTNGYPWGSLYDPSGAAQAATNALGSAAFASKGSFVASTNGIADGLTRTVASTNFAISQPSAGTTNVEAINSSGVEIAVPFADFSGGGSGDFGFTNGINTNAPIGFYYYDTNHFGIGTNSPVGNKSFGSASTNNTGDFDTNGAAAASSIITSNALVSTINALPYTIKLSSTNGIFTPTSNGSGQTNWTFTLTNLAGLDAGFVKLVDARGQTNTGTISLDAGNIHTDIYGGNPSILGTRVQEGFGTTASGSQAHAEGNDTTASGGLSHAEGNSTTASGGNSHAEGSFTIAAGQDSHSEGLSNVVDSTGGVGVGVHVEGVDNYVSADYAHVEGFSNTNTGYYTHVEGASNYVDAIFGHAEGWNNQANGYGTHAEGIGNIASFHGLGAVTAAHAEGYGTTAEGANSHSEGSNTLAYGVDSYAGGANSTASNNSYAWSDGTALISPSNNTYSVTATNGVYLNGGVTGIHGNGLSLTNIPISGINTNGGSAGQVATVSGGSVVWSTPTSGTVTGATLAFPNTSLTGAVSTANGSIGLTIGLTNTPTLNASQTFTGVTTFSNQANSYYGVYYGNSSSNQVWYVDSSWTNYTVPIVNDPLAPASNIDELTMSLGTYSIPTNGTQIIYSYPLGLVFKLMPGVYSVTNPIFAAAVIGAGKYQTTLVFYPQTNAVTFVNSRPFNQVGIYLWQSNCLYKDFTYECGIASAGLTNYSTHFLIGGTNIANVVIDSVDIPSGYGGLDGLFGDSQTPGTFDVTEQNCNWYLPWDTHTVFSGTGSFHLYNDIDEVLGYSTTLNPTSICRNFAGYGVTNDIKNCNFIDLGTNAPNFDGSSIASTPTWTFINCTFTNACPFPTNILMKATSAGTPLAALTISGGILQSNAVFHSGSKFTSIYNFMDWTGFMHDSNTNLVQGL